MASSCTTASCFSMSGSSSTRPEQADLMRAYVPIATNDGELIEGLVRIDCVVRQPAFDHSLWAIWGIHLPRW